MALLGGRWINPGGGPDALDPDAVAALLCVALFVFGLVLVAGPLPDCARRTCVSGEGVVKSKGWGAGVFVGCGRGAKPGGGVRDGAAAADVAGWGATW